jgi:hypothetical protein
MMTILQTLLAEHPWNLGYTLKGHRDTTVLIFSRSTIPRNPSDRRVWSRRKLSRIAWLLHCAEILAWRFEIDQRRMGLCHRGNI